MGFIIRCAIIYAFILLVFRIAGKRALADVTTFDIVLLLIISETTQQALVVDDYSLVNAMLLIGTFVGLDMLLSFAALRSPRLDRWMNSSPLAIVQSGRVMQRHMKESGINLDEVLAAGRQQEGITELKQVEHAVLECNGTISVIPRERSRK